MISEVTKEEVNRKAMDAIQRLQNRKSELLEVEKSKIEEIEGLNKQLALKVAPRFTTI